MGEASNRDRPHFYPPITPAATSPPRHPTGEGADKGSKGREPWVICLCQKSGGADEFILGFQGQILSKIRHHPGRNKHSFLLLRGCK